MIEQLLFFADGDSQKINNFSLYRWSSFTATPNRGSSLFHGYGTAGTGRMYFSGGASNGLPSTDFYSLQSNGATEDMGVLPQALCAHFATVIDGYYYVTCGMIDNNRTYTGITRRMNLVTKEWELLASAPTSLAWFDGTVIGTDIWLLGGNPTPSGVESPAKLYCYKYDTVANTWTSYDIVGVNPRIVCGVCSVGTDLYILGGRYGGVYRGDFYRIDSITLEATKLADHPYPHGSKNMLYGFAEEATIVDLGGQLAGDQPYRSSYLYDIETDEWKFIADNGWMGAYAPTAYFNNKFYKMGGRLQAGNAVFSR